MPMTTRQCLRWRLLPSWCLLCIIACGRAAFVPKTTPCSPCRTTPLEMISFGAGSQQQQELPRDVKDAVSKCRAAVQEALGKRVSRMDIEMPVGAKFGVEKDSSKKTRRKTMMGAVENEENEGVSRDVLEKSDRELARLFVEMFQPLGGEHLAVVFNDDSSAEIALKKWKDDASASCRVLSLGRKRKTRGPGSRGMGASKKKKKPMGFAAKMAAEVDGALTMSGPFLLPEGTELALFVAPGPKELIQVEKVCKQVGMDTCVIILNARLGKIDNFGTDETAKLFLEDFEPVFHLAAAPQEEAPGCLMYRAYPNEWIMARKPKVGVPKPVMSQSERPSGQDCRDAFQSIDVGDVEKGVENVLENVAGWFN